MKLVQKIRQSSFARDVFALSGGTAIAQAILIGILPVLTRIYTPEDFGIFTLYVSITSLVSVFASFHYEQMIMLTKSHRTASQLVWLILLISMATATVAFVIALLFRHPIARLLGAPEIAPWLFGVPVSLFFLGTYNALRYWKMRQRQFGVVSRAVVGRSTSFALVATTSQNALPAAVKGSGLIIAQIAGTAINMLILFFSLRKHDRLAFAPASKKRMAATARRYAPMAATLTASLGIGQVSARLPHYMLSTFFGTAALGFYGIAERIISIPSQLIAQAVGDVFRQRASVAFQKQGRFDTLMLKTIVLTASIAIIPYSLGIVYAPELFSLVLGAEWETAGKYASILLIGNFFSFVISPIDKAAIIVDAKKYLIYWSAATMIAQLVILALLLFQLIDLYGFLWAITISQVVIYVGDGIFEYSFARLGKSVVG